MCAAKIKIFPPERILHQDEFVARGVIDRTLLDMAIEQALWRIKRNIAAFGEMFPAPSSENGIYPVLDNIEWTSGFWSGLNWLAYQYCGETLYRETAERHIDSFANRIVQRIGVDTHDLGFLYSLSCVAAYKVVESDRAKAAALSAADLLMQRFLPAAGIIQAWGDLSDPAQAGRMIIDCNLNLPLLYWASRATGNLRYAQAADSHVRQAAAYLVRPDSSSFHTFFMDSETGEPRFGKTHQGYSDTSCWSRGQAWGILGFPLNYRYNANDALIATSVRLANYFLNRLPPDLICSWDLIFTDPQTPRDSSAAAIAACGLLELAKYLPTADCDIYRCAAVAIVQSLAKRYTDAPDKPGGGLLMHGVYHMPNRVGVDECCIWGDYFYLEALMRLSTQSEFFW